ncbi:MAG: glycosyltransferase family 9 protein [Spirochaetes bacterium]|nr:glycosyltransferase family 9 protein [Spirochaetota bacterium]
MRDKVLFLRLGALGDLLVSLSALETVVDAHPGKEVVLCGNALWLEILKAYPQMNIRRMFILRGKYRLEEFFFDSEWKKTGRDTTFYRLCTEAGTLYNLRFESLRYSWLAFLKRVPVRYGSSPRFFRFLFTHWFGWLGHEPPIHERDWLNEIVTAAPRAAKRFRGWRFNRLLMRKCYPSEDYKERNQAALPAMQLNATADILRRYDLQPRRYLLVNPTASRRDKAWPAENFKRLGAFLKENFPAWDIRIIGSPAESDWLAEAAGSQKILQPQTLSELFAILAGAAALITNTSSMQFIAAATGVPTLTLMGWAHPLRWGPLGGNNLVIRGETSDARNIFERDGASYRSIAPATVEAEASAWLKSRLPR